MFKKASQANDHICITDHKRNTDLDGSFLSCDLREGAYP